jgi:hypothetical protein
MRGSGFAREARRRPELDLMVGPLEAAAMEGTDGSRSDPATIDAGSAEPSDLPSSREEG